VEGGGLGVKPVGLTLLDLLLYIYNQVFLPSLAMVLSKALSIRMWSDLAWSARFGGPAKPLSFLKIWIQFVIGNFLTTTWKPLIGPHGSLPFSHVIHCSIILPCQCHIILWMPRDQTNSMPLPTLHATSVPCHCTEHTDFHVEKSYWSTDRSRSAKNG
jgi:hypothetical protein